MEGGTVVVLCILLGALAYCLCGGKPREPTMEQRHWAREKTRQQHATNGNRSATGGVYNGDYASRQEAPPSQSNQQTAGDAGVLPPLPTDPAQCIRRLMMCPEEDFYQILNVPKDATAGEIKKSYLKQSLKVHPDKHTGSSQPAAEEAFKKLSFANEILGNPDVRAQYDFERSDAVKQQFSEIEQYVRLLKERREEAKRKVFCNKCHASHPKTEVDRPWQAARYCWRCEDHHPAKEGDVWLETRNYGSQYCIFGRIDDVIVDITEWGTCQGLASLEPGSHKVQITLKDTSTKNDRKAKKKGGKPGKRKPQLGDGPGDISVEEFMEMLMKNAGPGGERENAREKPPPPPSNNKKKKSPKKKK